MRPVSLALALNISNVKHLLSNVKSILVACTHHPQTSHDLLKMSTQSINQYGERNKRRRRTSVPEGGGVAVIKGCLGGSCLLLVAGHRALLGGLVLTEKPLQLRDELLNCLRRVRQYKYRWKRALTSPHLLRELVHRVKLHF